MQRGITLTGIILTLSGIIAFSGKFLDKSWSVRINHIGTYSSPRAIDLNSDGIKDIVIGLGQLEFNYCDTAVLALNGKNGEVLWHTSGHDQMFGSASFADLNGDGQKDVVINGRSAELKAIDGTNGKVLWEYFTPKNRKDSARFHGLYNFYNARFVPDQNQDDIPEIIVTNGGDVLAAPHETDRTPGSLMVISGKDGKLIARAIMPDEKETYISIVVDDLDNNKTIDIIFGSGGESIGGNLYRTTLEAVLQEDLSQSALLATSATKGFIAPPVLVDITGDGIKDIVANAVDGRMLAFDGSNNQEVWTVTLPGTEAYSSLAVGHFNDDTTPDFFGSFATGVWPDLSWSKQIMVDGKSGQIQFQDSVGYYQTTTPVVADFNGDGRDDALLPVNYQVINLIWTYHYNLLMVFDFHNNTTYQIGESLPGINVSATPWIGDVDNDEFMDIIYSTMGDSSNTTLTGGVQVNRLSPQVPMRKPVFWGAYMGSNYDGIFPGETVK